MGHKLKNCEEKCTVADCFILKYCSPEWYKKIKNKIKIDSYSKGQKIIFQGSQVNWICIVRSGKIKVFNTSNTGREVIFRLVKKGDILGYSAVGNKLIYSSSASAIEETSVCFIPKDIFIDLVVSNTRVTNHVVLHLLDELRKAEMRILNLALLSAKQRIAGTLIMLEEIAGKNNGELELALTRQEIADFAATSQEETSRVISILKKEGIIKEGNNKKSIIICNRTGLLKTAQ